MTRAIATTTTPSVSLIETACPTMAEQLAASLRRRIAPHTASKMEPSS